MKTTILIGSWLDPQCTALEQFADIVCHWESWSREWQISIVDGDVSIQLFDGPNGEATFSAGDCHVYIRYPGCPRAAEDEYLGLIANHKDMLGVARPGSAPTNKLTSLQDFGPWAPHTVVTNYRHELSERPDWIVKNMSPLRSMAAPAGSLLHGASNPRLSIPVMAQERLRGREYKAHFIKLGGSLRNFTVEIIKADDVADYRYNDGGFLCRRHDDADSRLAPVVASLAARGGCRFWDIDYMVTDSGQLKILEWNDSPESVSFEKRCSLRHDYKFSRLVLATPQVVYISPRNDRVIDILVESSPTPGTAVRLDCEDYLKRWHVSMTGDSLVFYQDGKPIIPLGVYCRPVNVPRRLAQEYDDLFRAIELWEGRSFGDISLGFYNSSKILQTHHSLRQARKSSQTAKDVRFPRSWFIKGTHDRLRDLLAMGGAGVIVKSCSGARSVVVDQNIFRTWDSSGLSHLPTLFQEAIIGDDIRVHCLRDQTFAVRVDQKDSIDYRYATERGHFNHFVPNQAIDDFCREVARIENNPLVGLDFLEKDGVFYCLEANPSPGWNWYYNPSTCDTNRLALGILEELTHGAEV